MAAEAPGAPRPAREGRRGRGKGPARTLPATRPSRTMPSLKSVMASAARGSRSRRRRGAGGGGGRRSHAPPPPPGAHPSRGEWAGPHAPPPLRSPANQAALRHDGQWEGEPRSLVIRPRRRRARGALAVRAAAPPIKVVGPPLTSVARAGRAVEKTT